MATAPLQRISLAGLACLAALTLATGAQAQAQSAVGLGTAGSYAVLSGSSVTNTGPSVINGDLGVSPGTALTGFPPGTVNGATHVGDAAAAQAQADLTVAYDDAAGRGPASTVSGDLGNQTLAPGVYRSGSSLGLTGTLTLDGQANPDSVFILQAGSSLTTASGSRVALINGAQACNVFWQIGSSATLGTSSTFVGSILALTSISVNDGVTVDGRLLARNGAVTLINDTVTTPRCAAQGTDGATGGTGGTDGTGGTGGTGGTPQVAEETPDQVGPPGVPVLPPAFRRGPCVERTFRINVTGSGIERVVFSVRGRRIANQTWSPFAVLVQRARPGSIVRARVTFIDDARAAQTLRVPVRACSQGRARVSPSRNPQAPPAFTG